MIDDDDARHLHDHNVGACFGEWSAAGDGSTEAYELVLMPEETAYLSCIVGCLDVDFGSNETAFACSDPTDGQLLSPATRLPRLLDLAVEADPALAGDFSFEAALQRLVVYSHYRHKGLVVKDGVLLGTHFLLYRGAPSEVHSDYAIWVCGVEEDWRRTRSSEFQQRSGGAVDDGMNWLHVQALSRLLKDVSKKLVLCSVDQTPGNERVVEICFG